MDGQHITEVFCQGELIAVFTKADYHCRESGSVECSYWESDDRTDCTDGYLCMFALALQEPIHVIRHPDCFRYDVPMWYDVMCHKWSHDSRQLMVYWRGHSGMKVFVACLSKDAQATRQVGCLRFRELSVSEWHAREC